MDLDPISLLFIAGGLTAKHIAQRKAIERQQKFQQAMESFQREKAQGSERAIGEMLENQTADKRAAEIAGLEKSRTDSMNATLDQARASSPVTVVAGANTSADYKASEAAAADRVADRTRRAIAALATTGAPGEAAVEQGIRFGRTAGVVDANNQAIGTVGRGYMRDINNVQPNPWLELAGDIGTTVGTAKLLSPNSVPRVEAANNGAGFEDASGNLYDPSVTTPEDARIQRQKKMNRAFGIWGNS